MRAIERRDYYRMVDQVDVSLKVVAEETMRETSAEALFGVEQAFQLKRDLYRLELEARELQREVASEDRRLGSLVHNINRRLELIATAATGFESVQNSDLKDFSAAGIACFSDTLLDPGTLVAVRLLNRRNTLGVASYGMVRYCLLEPDDRYRLGIQFVGMDADSEALLTRHISSLQAEARRARLRKG